MVRPVLALLVAVTTILVAEGVPSPYRQPPPRNATLWYYKKILETVRGDQDIAGKGSLRLKLNESCLEIIERKLETDVYEGMKMLDAWGKPGAGILDGNVNFYGSYDECLAVKEAKYCALSLINPSASYMIPVAMEALCLPEECSISSLSYDIDFLLYQLNSSYVAVGYCANDEESLSPGAIVMVIVTAWFGAMIVFGTLLDFYRQTYARKRPTLEPIDRPIVNDQLQEKREDTPLLNDSTIRVKKRFKPLKVNSSLVLDIFLAFSLYKTIPTIFGTTQPPNAIRCINGIRVLSMFWVIMAHTHVWLFQFHAVDNANTVVNELAPRFSYQVILNGFFSVDSFFFLSGLLVSYLTLRQMERRRKKGYKFGTFPFLTYYVHRILRLTPAYAFVLFFFWSIGPYLGNGPYWNGVIMNINSTCPKYWWTNLLYINNFYPKFAEQCVAWTWYLANDMQFYVVSPLLLIPLFFLWPLGIALLCVGLFFSLVATGALVGAYNLPLNAFVSFKYTNFDGIDFNDVYYGKPYCRISPYLVGLFLGFVIYKGIKIPVKSRFVKVLIYGSMIIASFAITFSVIYGIYPIWNGHIPSVTENVIYLTFSRFAWGVALALLVFACHNRYGGWIDTVLSWGFWVPLSRLTFLAYLVHPIVLFSVIGSLRGPLHFTDVTVAVYMIASVVLSYATAALFAVVVEFPLSNLEMAIFDLLGIAPRTPKEAKKE